MLEKARGIHLWLFWLISSAQFCISITLLSAQPKKTSCIREHSRHSLAGLPNSRAKFYPQAKLPIASARGRHEYLKAKPGLKCVTEISHFMPWEGSGPTASSSWPAGCVEAVLTLLPAQTLERSARGWWEGKVPVKFSLQPMFSSIWKNHCNSSILACIRMTNTLQRQ